MGNEQGYRQLHSWKYIGLLANWNRFPLFFHAKSFFTWNPQRDPAIHLSELERKSFRMSAKVYLNPNHTFCTLDDDLMEMRADDNPHKTVIARNTDREGQSMTAVPDAFFRVFLHSRLARRCETKKVAVTKLLGELLENRGERC